jgi:hypothetical protein
MRTPRLLRAASLSAIILASACASVLGIEEVYEDSRPGAGGNSGASGGSSGGTNPTAGTSSAEGGTGDAGSAPIAGAPLEGGSAGETGGGAAGDGGSPPTDPTVIGRVVDYYRRALPNVPVQIGATQAITDDEGQFTIPEVSPEYDVSLVASIGGETYAWVYQGLTRRDPTLQIYSGLTSRNGNISIQPQNVTVGNNQTITVGIGGPDGDAEITSIEENGVNTSASWRGGSTTQATAHGLYWQYNATTELPTSYLAYDSKPVTLSSSTTADIVLDFTTSTLTAGTVQGTVTPGSSDNRENNAFVRFPTGATIQLFNDFRDNIDTFGYLVPSIDTGSITVSASEGHPFFGEYAVVHQDGLAPGASNVMLAIPAPPIQVSPAHNATGVDSTTTFSFQGSGDSSGAYVVAIESDTFYEVLYVVTERKQLKLPDVLDGGFTLRADHVYFWRVETHGDYATVDGMTGPAGYMDSFSGDFTTPTGPNAASGRYTLSTARYFTTAE